MARDSKNASLLGPGTLSTSLPVCLICPITSARRRAVLRLLPARIRTSRRASCCCLSSIASIRRWDSPITLLPALSCPLLPTMVPQALRAGYGDERCHLIRAGRSQGRKPQEAQRINRNNDCGSWYKTDQRLKSWCLLHHAHPRIF